MHFLLYGDGWEMIGTRKTRCCCDCDRDCFDDGEIPSSSLPYPGSGCSDAASYGNMIRSHSASAFAFASAPLSLALVTEGNPFLCVIVSKHNSLIFLFVSCVDIDFHLLFSLGARVIESLMWLRCVDLLVLF